MLKLKDVCSCIRLLHPDLQQRVKPDTLKTYKQHLDPFLAYLSQKWELQQLSPEDVDLLIMEYRTEFDITRSQHSQLVAAVLCSTHQTSPSDFQGSTQRATFSRSHPTHYTVDL